MQMIISKSQFKPQVLAYLRAVETQKKSFVITHAGKPVAKVVPYTDIRESSRSKLKGSIVFYAKPFEPVGLDDWKILP